MYTLGIIYLTVICVLIACFFAFRDDFEMGFWETLARACCWPVTAVLFVLQLFNR